MKRTALLVATMMLTLAAPALALTGASANASAVHHVYPGESIQAAVDAAKDGDVVHVHAGVYHEAVHVRSPYVTIRGDGKDATILDGIRPDGSRIQRDGIFVTVDGVRIQDLQVRNYGGNGVFYSDVTGFYMDRLSAIDNGPYGLYAIRSDIGHVQDSYARGHRDSGLYIGETAACDCILTGNLIEGNLIGYSGTGASHVIIHKNVFRDNAVGILPNVLPQEPTPQTHLIVTENEVYDNNNHWASENWHFLGMHVPAGWGILLAGGVNDIVKDNKVHGHEQAGIGLVWFFVQPSLNQVLHNALWDNGVDLWWDEGGLNNCWEDNYNPTGAPVTADGGPVWDTIGLPDCDTPNAGAPNPVKLARLASVFTMGCTLDQQAEGLEGPCHTGHEETDEEIAEWAGHAWKFVPQDVFGMLP